MTTRMKAQLALALSLILALGLFGGIGSPVYAGAGELAVNTATGTTYDDVSAALNEASDGETVQLLDNASPADNITYNRSGISVTLDLNGYHIIRDAWGYPGETETASAVYVEDGTLTIQDTSDSAEGYIKYENTFSSGSGLNVGAKGTARLLSGGILGAGQGVYVHDAGARFEMSGGLAYGYFDAPGSEALDAGSGAYVTVSGGYLGTYNQDALMIWSGSTLDPEFWSITGGYFTSKYYADGQVQLISNFVTQGEVTELNPTLLHPMTGATEYKYQLTVPRSITFNANGGVADEAAAVTDAGGRLASLPAATKEKAIFKGWYTAATGGTLITTGYVFTRDTVVYAQYEQVSVKEITPSAAVDYTAETLTGLEPEASYTINGVSLQTDSNGTVAVDSHWLGTELAIVKKGNGTGTTDSDPQLLEVPLRPSGPAVSKTDETGVSRNDGRITKVDSTMEYRPEGPGSWLPVSGEAVTGLAPGNYEVRIRATETAFVSEISTVTIAPVYSVKLITNGGMVNGSSVTAYTYGTAMELPDKVTLDNAAFAGWYTDNRFSGEPFTRIEPGVKGEVILYAKWTNTVTYNYNYPGAGVYQVQGDALHQELLTPPLSPVREGYDFVGWYQDEALAKPWYVNDKVTADMTLYARWDKPAYRVTGTVLNDEAPVQAPVSGAVVRILQGNVQYGSTAATDESGNFAVTGVPAGVYNLVITKDGKTMTVIVTIKDSNYAFGAGQLVLPQGNKNSLLEIIGSGTPAVVAGKLNELFTDPAAFTDKDKDIVNNGGAVKFKLSVEKQDANTVSGGPAIRQLAGNQTIAMYLDMTLTKTLIDGINSTETTLTTLGSLLQIIVPAELSGKSNVTVYRYHDGAAAQLQRLPLAPEDPAAEGYMLDAEGNRLIIYARNFSTYAVGYSTGGDSSGNTGGTSGSGSSGSPAAPAGGGSLSPSPGVAAPEAAQTTSELPYYYGKNGTKVFIGFAAEESGKMKYIAPQGAEVLFQPNPKVFTDIAGHWGKASIDFVSEREIFLGTGPAVFSPDSGMTRAMVATVLGRMYERSYGPLTATGTKPFRDSDYASWYGSYIDWSYQQGIIKGVGEQRFEPDRAVTRQELAAMLYRFSQLILPGGEAARTNAVQPAYSDAARIASWAKQAALYTQETGIITGRSGGAFAPQEQATRTEVAAILERFIEYVL